MTTVLLAEDDAAIAEPLSRALQREGYAVEVATDGAAALPVLSRRATQPSAHGHRREIDLAAVRRGQHRCSLRARRYVALDTTTAVGRDGPSEAMPRGTAGRLPWTYQVDLSFAYTPQWAEGLTAKMDVFNVFNEQEPIAVDDRAEDGTTGSPVSTYLVPRAFQQPRSVQFSVVYNF